MNDKDEKNMNRNYTANDILFVVRATQRGDTVKITGKDNSVTFQKREDSDRIFKIIKIEDKPDDGWVSVDDRLPEHNRNVLGYTNTGRSGG